MLEICLFEEVSDQLSGIMVTVSCIEGWLK